MNEIKELIAFYESKGWNWLSVVEFYIRRMNGTWPPPPLIFKRKQVGRPRTKSQP